MKEIIKRAFSRPIQLACYAVMGIATNHLLPKDPDAMQWVAYAFIYVAMLALGLDSYTEGMEKGIKVMEKLE
jgi:hypothetical protein